MSEPKYTQEQVDIFVHAAVTKVKRELDTALRERDEVIYAKEIAEWAVVGVVASRASVGIDISEAVDRRDRGLADTIVRRVAQELLYRAKLAFDAHTDLYALRTHVHYLENHAMNHGLSFTPWTDTDSTKEAFRLTRWAARPFPKSFSKATQ